MFGIVLRKLLGSYDVGPLANFRRESTRLNNTKVADFMLDGNWNVDMVTHLAPPQNVPSILSIQFHHQHLIPNQPYWEPTANGEFICSTAWNIIKEQRTKTKINTYTWHKNIPFK